MGTIEEKAKQQQAAMEARIRTVCENTGWDYEFAKKKMMRAKKVAGATFEYYAGFRLWELTEEQQKTYFMKRDADAIVNKFNTERKNVRIAWNKNLFLERFHDYVGRPWISTANMDLDRFCETFKNEEKIIYKPASSSAGAGIEVFDLREQSLQEVYAHIAQLDRGVVEGFLHQHPEMQKLSLKGVNTIRVVALQSDKPFTGIEPNHVYIAYAALRMCQGDVYTDNAHQGGLVAAVDLETGKLLTNGFDYKGEQHIVHPDTGTVIKGFQIPYFQEMKQMISEAGLLVPGYFGWDIAISETGPVVIELNSHPGAELLQLPYVPEHKGMRYVMERFIDAQPVTSKEPDKPYGLKISDISKDGIEFYWKKLPVANGYEVFRGYSESGPFEQIYDAPRRNIGTYRDNSFDHSQKSVFYTVRSYTKDASGAKTYSETVAPVEAKYIDELQMDRAVTYLYDGTTRKLKAVYGWGEPEDGVWSSSDTSVATVDQFGNITGVSTGNCEIQFSSPTLGTHVTSRVVVNRAQEDMLHRFPIRFHRDAATGYWKNPDAAQTDSAVIMMAGDMMCGKQQMTVHHSKKDGWDFTESFIYVKEITQEADFSVANLETLLAPGWPYMTDEAYIDNFNNCNATPRFLEAVRYGGIDAVMMANNHNCDGGVRALIETINQTDRYEFIHTGVFRSEWDDRFTLVDINGIRVGFIAYMTTDTGFNGKDTDWSETDKDRYLNIFTPEKARADIAACKARGAEYVILYMHWGKKNFRTMTKAQLQDAQAAADAGADYIVGANPHLVQIYDELKAADGRTVPCHYSTGNFVSVMNQAQGNRDSVIVRIRLQRGKDGAVRLTENNYIPCHTFKRLLGAKWTTASVSDRYHITITKPSEDKFRDYIQKTLGPKIKSL